MNTLDVSDDIKIDIDSYRIYICSEVKYNIANI